MGAALASLALVILAVARVQGGPRWEVPVAAMNFFFVACMSAGVLCVLAVLGFVQIQSTRFELRWMIATLSVVSAIAIIAALISSPEQWPITQPTLSSIVRKLAAPAFVLFLGAWAATLFVKSNEKSDNRAQNHSSKEAAD